MPDPKKKKTRMLKGTTVFGKTIPEIKKGIKNIPKHLTEGIVRSTGLPIKNVNKILYGNRDLSTPLSKTPRLKLNKGISTGAQEYVGKKKKR